MLLIGQWYIILISMVFGIPFGLLFLLGKVTVGNVVLLLVFFYIVGLLFLLLQSGAGAMRVRSTLPRVVTISNGQLEIAENGKKQCIELTRCTWYFGSTSADELCMYTGLRSGIVIQTPEQAIAIGHAEENLVPWRHFLATARIDEISHWDSLLWLGVTAVGMLSGFIMGSLAGCLASAIMNHHAWTALLAMVGVVEGSVIALLYALCACNKTTVARALLFSPLLTPFCFFLGVLACLSGDWTLALFCGVANATFGGSSAWFWQNRARSQERPRQKI